MTAFEPFPKVTIPEHLLALADDARLLRDLIDRGLERPPSHLIVPSSCEFLSERFARQLRASDQLRSVISGPLAALAASSESKPADADRITGRLEQILSDTLDEYRLLRGLENMEPFDRRDLDLIVAAQRHTLDEIRCWLQTLIEVLSNPVKELKGQRAQVRDECLEIPLTLTLTPPPQLAELERRLARKTAALNKGAAYISGNDDTPPKLGNSAWNTIGAVIFAFAAAHILFGGHNCNG